MTDRRSRRLPRALVLLGLVSLLMDMASELLYPVGPIYLTTVLGASAVWVGVMEGVAEAVAGLSKGFFGSLSDAKGRRRPFVTLGYALSAISKPLPALFPSVAGLLGSRVSDRIGKGIRTAPRDALLASYVEEEDRGRAFGLHRAMDTTGAAIGPVLALLWLAWHPGDYATLFLLAFLPAALAALTTVLVREERFVPVARRATPAASFAFWREAPSGFRRIVLLLTLFALANGSDAFLILRARQVATSSGSTINGDILAIGGYIGYNIVFAAAAYPAGQLSDRIGRRGAVIGGLLLHASAYLLFATGGSLTVIMVGFALYGLYAALTEGVVKAWIADLVPNERRGLAIGLQTMFASLAVLAANAWTGIVWEGAGAGIALGISAAAALVVAVLLATGIGRTGRSSVPLSVTAPTPGRAIKWRRR